MKFPTTLSLKNIMTMTVLGLTLLAPHPASWAGERARPEVVINMDNREANGSMVGARLSADTKQRIGCSISTGLFPLSCVAVDKTGLAVTCRSGDPQFRDLAHSITDSSFISFSFGTTPIPIFGGFLCTSLTVSNGSQYLR